MHSNNKKLINRFNRIKGQIEGIIKMIEDDKYCLDISNQVMAVNSALTSANKEIISEHLKSCVTNSLSSGNSIDIEEKMKEIETLIIKLGK